MIVFCILANIYTSICQAYVRRLRSLEHLYPISWHSVLFCYRILTRNVEAANNGMPPTLFQEACCGLTSGAIATYFCTPLYLAMSMKGHLYHTAAKEGVLALWKGVNPHANAIIAWNMGMLAPYNRCYNYFRESRGLSETRAIIGNMPF